MEFDLNVGFISTSQEVVWVVLVFYGPLFVAKVREAVNIPAKSNYQQITGGAARGQK